jgi:hypothetical protein
VYEEKKNGTFVSKVNLPRLTNVERAMIRENHRDYNRRYQKENQSLLRQKKKEYSDRIKRQGIAHYGGKCSCCGESMIEFLTLEHLNGRNPNEKRITGKKAWALAKAQGYPNTYTVLCFNCNCAKGAYGICPHMKKL